jgi:hypothetical protein
MRSRLPFAGRLQTCHKGREEDRPFRGEKA